MATVASPYGFKPVRMLGNQPYSGGTTEFSLISNVATAFFKGAPVSIASGVVTPCAATPTTTASTSTPIGIFMGCSYIDPVSKQYRNAHYLPAGAITAGYTNVKLYIADDPDLIFQIQADAPVALTAIGSNITIQDFTGSTVTGMSDMSADVGGLATTATLALRIVGVVDPGAAYTDILVKWNHGVHHYYMDDGL